MVDPEGRGEGAVFNSHKSALRSVRGAFVMGDVVDDDDTMNLDMHAEDFFLKLAAARGLMHDEMNEEDCLE